jgi:hypothetical protein
MLARHNKKPQKIRLELAFGIFGGLWRPLPGGVRTTHQKMAKRLEKASSRHARPGLLRFAPFLASFPGRQACPPVPAKGMRHRNLLQAKPAAGQRASRSRPGSPAQSRAARGKKRLRPLPAGG